MKDIVKTPRGTAAGCRRNATTTTTTPSPFSATNRLLTRKRAAHTPTPVVATPRAHHQPTPQVRTDYARLRSGYAAPDEAAAAMGFQRLRSGHPVVHQHDVYREGGETIQLQRQASRYPTLAYPSSEAMRRMASAVPAIRYFDAAVGAGEAASSDIQPAGFVSCPSTIRSPRTARMPHEECGGGGGGGGGAKPPSLDDAAAAAHGGWASARGPLYNRSASGYHHRHATTTTTSAADTYKISSGVSAVPATQCSVFERLTSNYYGASSSAAALRAPAALASPRGRHYATEGAGDSGAHAARRRHTSAPAGSAGRRIAKRSAGQRQVYPALREGWLSPDGKVAATRRATKGEEAGVAEEARGSAPEGNTFTRSNTSRYLNLNK